MRINLEFKINQLVKMYIFGLKMGNLWFCNCNSPYGGLTLNENINCKYRKKIAIEKRKFF